MRSGQALTRQPDGTSGMPLRPDWEIPRVLAR
jgi:hypothetical protein